jgi:hypothetical protein
VKERGEGQELFSIRHPRQSLSDAKRNNTPDRKEVEKGGNGQSNLVTIHPESGLALDINLDGTSFF